MKNCALNRDDEKENSNRNLSIENLEEEKYPTCVSERGTFMAKFPYYRTLKHPYALSSPDSHGHLEPTKVRFPQFSVAAVPYFWMRKENGLLKDDFFDLGFNTEMEPVLDWQKDKKKVQDGWVQEAKNQKVLLNCFLEHFEPNNSLVFLYAKQVPFVEDSGRVLVGVGRIKKIEESDLYKGSNKKFAAAYWESMVHHSIRDDFKDGFLLPYHEALEYQKEHPDFDQASWPLLLQLIKPLNFLMVLNMCQMIQRLEFCWSFQNPCKKVKN